MKYAIKNTIFREKLENININKFDIYHGEVFDYVRFNNIKFEIKSDKYTIGYKADSEVLNKIEKVITNLQFNFDLKKDRLNIKFKKTVKNNADIIDDLILILKNIEKLGIADETKHSLDTTPELFKVKFRSSVLAKKYFEAVRYKDQKTLNNFRILLNADDYDQFISLNKKTDLKKYREHLVPCIFLHKKIIQMILNENASIKSVAKLIKKYLKIVYISEENAFKLDYEFNLKTRMPKDWSWGDDIFARLKEANIKI